MLAAQWLLTLLVTLAVTAVAGPIKGVFVMLGGVLAMALSLLFAVRSFTVDAREDPEGALRAMRRAASGKLIAAIVVFVAAAKWVPDHTGQIILGYAVATISYWIALVRAPLGAPGQQRDETAS